jgi:hypothetical protein
VRARQHWRFIASGVVAQGGQWVLVEALGDGENVLCDIGLLRV